MRVVHYLREVRLEHGGVTRAVLDMAGLLASRGVEVVLLSVDDHDVPESWRAGGLPESAEAGFGGLPRAVRLDAPGGLLGRFTSGQLGVVGGYLRGADVLHLHTMWEPTNPQMGRLARSLGVPYALSVHGMLDEWSMRQARLKKLVYLRVCGARLLREAGGVHCVSPAELEQASSWFRGGHGRVIPLLFDLSPFAVDSGGVAAREAFGLGDELGASWQRPVLLFMSRIHYVKGLDRLLGGMKLVQSMGLRPVLIVAGRGTEEAEAEARGLVEALPHPEDVRFVGFVGGSLKVELLQFADVFVHPTSQENFGFSVFESLAAGTPVLTTRGVGMWRELESSGGALIREGTPDGVAGGIREFVEMGRYAASVMGERGRAWVRNAFDPSELASRYIGFYQELGGGHDPSATSLSV